MTDLTPDFKMLNGKIQKLHKYIEEQLREIRFDLALIRAKVEKGGCEASAKQVAITPQRIEALRQEVLESLARLEQIDTD